MKQAHKHWLTQLTGVPTAAGRETYVMAWIRRWLRPRRDLELHEDRCGNLEVRLCTAKAAAAPLYFVAHMDHPAFVVSTIEDERHLVADFRGGVDRSYFRGTPVTLHATEGITATGTVVREIAPRTRSSDSTWRIRLSRPATPAPGDILTWKLPVPRCTRHRLVAPACDNLAGVTAALAALDEVRRQSDPPDLRLLLTRGEEVGFVGAVGAARHRTVPKKARLLVIENSKSFAESPLGGGPVVRVGDRTSTFDIGMTSHLALVAESLERTGPGFRWQRRLMPGGTCEATAFVAYGLRAACVCLPLRNYHNMQEDPRRIAPESIDLHDFAALVRLLAAVAMTAPEATPGQRLRDRLESLYADRADLLRDHSDR